MIIQLAVLFILTSSTYAQETNLKQVLSPLQNICAGLDIQRTKLLNEQAKVLDLEKRTELLNQQKPNIDTASELKKLPETLKRVQDAKLDINQRISKFEESMIRRGCYINKDEVK